MKRTRLGFQRVVAYVMAIAMVLTAGTFSQKQNVYAAEVSYGTQQVALTAGTYAIPIAMYNAGDIQKPSMAAAAIATQAALEIGEDGSAKVTMEWKTLSVMGMKADATDIKIYQDNKAEGETVDAVIESEREGTNGENVPKKVSFTVPDTTTDGVYISMVAMGRTMQAYLALGYKEAKSAVALGSEGTLFTTGKYVLNVSLMNASNISNKSMAAGALCEKGYLTVKEDNTVELQTQWKTLAVFGLSGDASQIKVYQTNGTTGDTQDAVVDSTRKVQGTDGEVEVPEKVHFSMPVLQAQGAYINMFVGAMNMNVDAFVQVDYETAEAWVASSVEITQKEVTVEEGKTTSLSAVTAGTDASHKVTWASDNCDVATVDENTGLVTGVKKGTAHITATMDQVSDTALVTVTETKKEDAGNTGSGSDTGNTGSGSDTGNTGSGSDAGNTGSGSDAGNTGSGSDTGNTGNGSDTGNTGSGSDTGNTGSGSDTGNTGSGSDTGNTGSGSDTGNTGSGSDAGNTGSDSDDKENTQNTKAKITLNKKSVVLYTAGKRTMQLKATVTGSTSKTVWKSSNSKVVKVNQKGYVTAGKAGSAKITVKAGKVEATCKVTVKKASLWVSKNKVVLKKGKKTTIKAKAVPGNKITFTSSKKKVATVSSKGVIKGKKKGKAVITVSCNGLKKKITVKVK